MDGTAVGSTTSHSMSASVNMRDATTKDSGGFEESLPGLWSGGIGFEGFVAWDETYGFDELFDLSRSKTKVKLRFTGDTTGDTYFICDAYLESVDLDAPTEDNVSMSGSFKVTGGIRRKTFT